MAELVQQRAQPVVARGGVLLQPVRGADVRHRREQVVLGGDITEDIREMCMFNVC